MKHLFIVNPVAGGKHSRYKRTIEEIQAAMERVGEPFQIYVTKGPMDACDRIIREAESGEELRVYACGGDGTFNECVNGAAGRKNVAVTSYPCGTGNDFIKMFGGEAKLFSDIAALAAGPDTDIDVIDCNGRICANICSVGIDARIGTDVHKYSRIPLIGGPTGYVVSLVVNIIKGINSHFRITDGRRALDGEYSLICGCNGRYYGGGFNPVPEAQPDDGLIDFLIVGKVTFLQFLKMVKKYAAGNYKALGSLVTHIAGRSLEIESDENIVVNVDGEAIRAKKVTFKIVERGLRFFFPAGVSFFNKTSAKNEAI